MITFQEALDNARTTITEATNFEKITAPVAKILSGCIDLAKIKKAVIHEFRAVEVYNAFDVFIFGYTNKGNTVVKCFVTYVYEDEEHLEDVFMIATVNYDVKSQKILDIEVADISQEGYESKNLADKAVVKNGGVKA